MVPSFPQGLTPIHILLPALLPTEIATPTFKPAKVPNSVREARLRHDSFCLPFLDFIVRLSLLLLILSRKSINTHKLSINLSHCDSVTQISKTTPTAAQRDSRSLAIHNDGKSYRAIIMLLYSVQLGARAVSRLRSCK